MTTRSAFRAAILVGTLSSTPLPNAFFERHLNVPAIHFVVPRHRPPLDLDAPILRYVIGADGAVGVNHEPVGARACRKTCMRRR